MKKEEVEKFIRERQEKYDKAMSPQEQTLQYCSGCGKLVRKACTTVAQAHNCPKKNGNRTDSR